MRFKALLVLVYFACSLAAQQPSAPTPEARLAEARQQIEQGAYQEAAQALKRLEAESPQLKGLAHELGVVSYKIGDYLATVKYFERASAEDPNDKVAIQLRGLSLFYLGSAAKAVPLLEQVHGWYPVANVDATYVLGLAYLQTKDYEKARRTFGEMFGVAPDSAASYLFMARMLLRQGFDPVAEEHAQKAAALDPKLPGVHYLLGEFYLFNSKYDAAAREFETELKLNPAFAASYDRLADVYFRTGRFDDAHRLLQRAILLDPNSTGPYILMGKVMLKKNDPQQALLYLQRAAKMDPGNYITHHLMGQVYRALKNTEAAERELKLAEQLQQKQNPLQPLN
jgi:tetratricopeptide (TPR) repeat protein